jgi:hypothetical protein
MPANTKKTTDNKNTTPALVPLLIKEAGSPKQTEQAIKEE